MQEIIYKFYSEDDTWDIYEYSSLETTKDEMRNDIINHVFKDHFLCIREKYVNWKMRYKCKFLLQSRRDNKNFVSAYKQSLALEVEELTYSDEHY